MSIAFEQLKDIKIGDTLLVEVTVLEKPSYGNVFVTGQPSIAAGQDYKRYPKECSWVHYSSIVSILEPAIQVNDIVKVNAYPDLRFKVMLIDGNQYVLKPKVGDNPFPGLHLMTKSQLTFIERPAK